MTYPKVAKACATNQTSGIMFDGFMVRISCFFFKNLNFTISFLYFYQKNSNFSHLFFNFYEVFLNMGPSGCQKEQLHGEDLMFIFQNLNFTISFFILFLTGASLGPPGRPHMRQDFVHLQDLASIYFCSCIFPPRDVFFMFFFAPGCFFHVCFAPGYFS